MESWNFTGTSDSKDLASLMLASRAACGVAKHKVLKRVAVCEPQALRAQPADRARRDFEHPHSAVIHAHFGVHGSVRQADGRDCRRRGASDRLLRFQRLGGRR